MQLLSLVSLTFASSLASPNSSSSNEISINAQTVTASIPSALLLPTQTYQQGIPQSSCVVHNVTNDTLVMPIPEKSLSSTTPYTGAIPYKSLLEKKTFDTATRWFLLCGGSDMRTNTFQNVCVNDPNFLVPISGERCQQSCTCTDNGKLDCPSPATGCSDNGAVTALCGSDINTTFTCLCHKETDSFKSSTAMLQNGVALDQTSSSDLKNSDRDEVPTFCSGKSLTDTSIAGTCMDGNFLWWAGNDCSRYCVCNGFGKLKCSYPSDCGPSSTINDYCHSNANFHCDCLSNRKRYRLQIPNLEKGNEHNGTEAPFDSNEVPDNI